MKLEIFPVTVFIGNIDLKKIKLTAKMGQSFLSKTPSSFDGKNTLDSESSNYLISTIAKLLEEQYQHFTVRLLNTWRNKYLNNDSQEPHYHTGSQFSFIIYEKVNVPHTVFFNPAKYLMDATRTFFIPTHFKPQMRKGQIIIFPSYIEHMVSKNSDQVTISGNIEFKFNK